MGEHERSSDVDQLHRQLQRLRTQLAIAQQKAENGLRQARAEGDSQAAAAWRTVQAELQRVQEATGRVQAGRVLMAMVRRHGPGPYSRAQIAALSDLPEDDIRAGMAELRAAGILTGDVFGPDPI